MVATRPVDQEPSGIAVGFGSVWVSNEAANAVVRIDPEADAVGPPIGVGNGRTAIGASSDGVWVANVSTTRCR